MPTVSFASSKGGCGKSTSAILLATELAERGAGVTIIDADPNRPVAKWARRPGKPDSLKVISDVTERTIIDTIESEVRKSAFVIVDLEGTASRMIPYAMSRSDLVIVPSRGSVLDAMEAVAAIREVKEQEKAFRTRIPSAVLFTCTSPAIKPRTLASIEAEFNQNSIPVFKTRIVDREAFRALFSYGGTLTGLGSSQASNVAAAVQNARAFTAEVVKMLRDSEGRAAA
jgi:chromosome partitioning protein